MMTTWELQPLRWRQPLRISQTNLQARDTPRYRPEMFMRQLAEMDNNVAIANAGGIYAWHAMTGAPDTHYDRRNLPIHAEFNAFLKEHEAFFRDASPVTPVALLWSRTSLERYGADRPEERYQHEFFGFCEALLGHGIPFTVIPEQFLEDGALAAHETLVLPNAACLSGTAAAAIRRFAGAGTVRHDVVPVHDLRQRVPDGTRRAPALALGQDQPLRDGAAHLHLLRTWEIVAVEVAIEGADAA